MIALRAVLSRIRGIFAKSRMDREFAEELEAHLQEHIEDNIMSRDYLMTRASNSNLSTGAVRTSGARP